MRFNEIQQNVIRVADRLRELGHDVPPMPASADFEESSCPKCNGSSDGHCGECGGSGIVVRSPIAEWNRKVSAILNQVYRGRS